MEIEDDDTPIEKITQKNVTSKKKVGDYYEESSDMSYDSQENDYDDGQYLAEEKQLSGEHSKVNASTS